MLGRTVFAATLLALAEFAVAASTPPACLLNAASQSSSPIDIKSVCQSKDLKTMVSQICGNDAEAAMAALSDICNAQSVQIPSGVPSVTAPLSTGSPKSTGSLTASHVVPLYPTGTGSSSHSGGNSTVPAATGTPKPPVSSSAPSATTSRVPNNNGAGVLELSFAAVVAGVVAAAL